MLGVAVVVWASRIDEFKLVQGVLKKIARVVEVFAALQFVIQGSKSG